MIYLPTCAWQFLYNNQPCLLVTLCANEIERIKKNGGSINITPTNLSLTVFY